MLADAYLNDNAFAISSWAEVSGLTPRDCVAIRRSFLCCLSHDLNLGLGPLPSSNSSGESKEGGDKKGASSGGRSGGDYEDWVGVLDLHWRWWDQGRLSSRVGLVFPKIDPNGAGSGSGNAGNGMNGGPWCKYFIPVSCKVSEKLFVLNLLFRNHFFLVALTTTNSIDNIDYKYTSYHPSFFHFCNFNPHGPHGYLYTDRSYPRYLRFRSILLYWNPSDIFFFVFSFSFYCWINIKWRSGRRSW
jgi:hypothetical protein